MEFKIEKDIPGQLGRAGRITTAHGAIDTPAFIVVGTKATVKALAPEQIAQTGAQAVLANTYHLYLEPGPELIEASGGLGKFMNWAGPTWTDSGGFQAFSLGAAYGRKISKVGIDTENASDSASPKLAKIDDDGVTFRSPLDGREHRFTSERSIQIQRQIGADIIFAFDECTAPDASLAYQQAALRRTHDWAHRSLAEHKKSKNGQALFGIVQGGRFQSLREESARVIGGEDFDGFGIGGSFTKDDIETAVTWVNALLPVEKPRHLLGIGTVQDIIAGVRAGADTFDCVTPTREGRNGSVETKQGRVNILNARFRSDLAPIEADCACYTCRNFSRAYLAHLFRAKEMLAATLASIHNVHFFAALTRRLRQAILTGNFDGAVQRILTDYRDAI